MQARKEEKQRKGQQQQQMEYLTSRLQKKAPAAATATEAEEDDVDEEEAALDESLDQVGYITWIRRHTFDLPSLSLIQSNCISFIYFSISLRQMGDPMHVLCMIDV